MSVRLDAKVISGNDNGKVRESKVDASLRSESKQEGTRVGTLGDYRGAGKAVSIAGRRNQLRDGS